MNQFNKKLKLMIEIPKYVIYSIVPLHMRALWVGSMDATHALLIHELNIPLEMGGG